MQTTNALMERLRLSHPIIQAPMAGGGDTPALVSAVSGCGALGCIGATYLSPAQIAEAALVVQTRTSRPFGINLFAPLPLEMVPAPSLAVERVTPYYAELGLPPPEPPTVQRLPFAEQFAVALGSGASVFSFTFALLPPEVIAAAKTRGMFVMGTATTVEEALALKATGVDAIVAQGSEAGGHRGTFMGEFEQAMIGTMALVPQIADAAGIPVVASGGIMDGRGIAAALALGASAVQMGTAFLTCEEAGIPEAYKQRILQAGEHETRLTKAFSGRLARGIVNRFIVEVERQDGGQAILPFPLQNALTRPLRNAAAKEGRAEFLSLWAGQGTRLARRGSAVELIERLARETEASLRRLAEAFGGKHVVPARERDAGIG
jgi:nitronate monooxygenase